MSEEPRKQPAGPSAGTSRGGWVHFGVGAAILFVAAAGFQTAERMLRIHLVKAPVPWPEGTEVDEHQRLANFPAKIGPYVLAADGELQQQRDSEPDGQVVLRKEQVKDLGTTKHPLNWYFAGIYRDTRVPLMRRRGRHFQLDLTYYTGLVDPVPHVPEKCLPAGGQDWIRDRSGPVLLSVPGAPKPWDKFKVRRIAYTLRDAVSANNLTAQYYVFSTNGEPSSRRLAVRYELIKPSKKYCYFAKIQVAPRHPDPGFEANEKACLDFLRHALPAILRFLPSAEDVKRLEDADSRSGSGVKVGSING